MPVTLEHRFVPVTGGTVHCVVAGSGPPVVLLHQTPRSWDEYRDVIPLLAPRRQVIAMDTLGFGDSSRLPSGEDTIERWAQGVVDLLDGLGLDHADLVGHHTGAYVATEVAAAAPGRVRSAVLSGMSLHGKEKRLARAAGRAVVDDVEHVPNGSHLLGLWDTRAAFYPADRVDLLDRYLADCLRAGPLAAEGHRVVARYAVEERLPLLTCPVRFVFGDRDPHSYPDADKLHQALPHSEIWVIEGGMVPLPDQLPEEFASAVVAFLARIDAVTA